MQRFPPFPPTGLARGDNPLPDSVTAADTQLLLRQSSSNNIQIQSAAPIETFIDYGRSNETFVGVRFIQECGSKLGLECLTVATAVGLFHNFFRVAKKEDGYDQYLVAGSCLYLAGKLEENQQLRVRDVINVVHDTLHMGDAEPLNLESEYYNMREAICQMELLVLRMVKFQTKFDHPHKYLLHYLRSVRDWVSEDVWLKYPIAKTSWALLQDFYHDSRILETDSSHVGIACIAIALETYGIQIPFVSDTSWISAFSESLTKERLWEIMVIIMEVYSKDAVYIAPLNVERKISTII